MIAGGGVAALEAVLALREWAGAEFPIELICPRSEFEYRPLLVLEPFVEASPETVDLGAFAKQNGVALHQDSMAAVDRGRKIVRTAGDREVSYRALLVALGAQALPGLEGTQSFSNHADAAALRKALEGFKPGSEMTLAFAITDRRGWVLPLYELALLSRAMLDERGASDAQVVVLTAEKRPLEALGEQASSAVELLLSGNRVELRTKVKPVSFNGGVIRLRSGGDLPADHVVAQPRMRGAAIEGLRQSKDGFIRVDAYCRARRQKGVYAAGDITAGFAKQGGLAARQAEVAAGAILADLGYPIDPAWFEPEMEAVLLTGPVLEQFREADRSGDWTPPSKISAYRLSAYLGTREPDPRRWGPGRGEQSEIELGERWT